MRSAVGVNRTRQFPERTSTDLGVTFHTELAFIFICDAETEPLIESASGIDCHHIQSYSKIQRGGFTDQSLHHLRTYALTLKSAVHKHLCDKKLIIFPGGLQPSLRRYRRAR